MATTADVTITLTQLVPGTASADLIGSGTAVNATETFRVKVTPDAPFPPAAGGETRLIFIFEELNTGAATITFEAGDYPPALQSPMGPDAVALAQADVRAFVLEAGRHLKADGYVKALVSGNNCRVRVLRMPAGY